MSRHFKIYHKELEKYLNFHDGYQWVTKTDNCYQEEIIAELLADTLNPASEYINVITNVCAFIQNNKLNWRDIVAVPLDENGQIDFTEAMEVVYP